MYNHIDKLLYRIFRVYDIPITYHTIEQVVSTHPEFPSIQSISDAFDVWQIKHIVLRLTIEKLKVLNAPVIVQMKKGNFIWIKRFTDSTVQFWNNSGKLKSETQEHFEKEWTGIALVIEDLTYAGEHEYKKNHLKEIKEEIVRYCIVVVSFVLLSISMGFAWINDNSLSLLPKFILFVVNTIGGFICYQLILQGKNQSGRLVRKFCTAGTHIDCNQVTRSKYSKLFGLISWAEIGMIYFSSVALWIAVAPVSDNWIAPLWWFVLVSLPFTLWSLFSQAFLIHKYCLFCCAIVLLLWINEGIVFFLLPFPGIGGLLVIESTYLGLLVLGSINVVLCVIKTNVVADKYFEQRELAKVKYDYQTIQSQLFSRQFQLNTADFMWGNPLSSQKISLYVSIGCSHCGAAIKEFRKLTKIYPDFGYQLIFSVNTNDCEHRSNLIVRHFLCLSKIMDTNTFFDMLEAWYTTLNKKLEALQLAFPVLAIDDNKEIIYLLYQFGQQAKINHTPAILLNGRLLSKLYSYQDLFGVARTLYAEDN